MKENSIEALKKELEEKENTFEEKYINNFQNNYLSEEACKLRKDIVRLNSEIREKERKPKTIDELYSYTEKVYKAIVEQDDEYTKQVIVDYVRRNYPNENVKIDFLDEEIVRKIIDLGIAEYQKRYETKVVK